jgi:hypothetical protein
LELFLAVAARFVTSEEQCAKLLSYSFISDQIEFVLILQDEFYLVEFAVSRPSNDFVVSKKSIGCYCVNWKVALQIHSPSALEAVLPHSQCHLWRMHLDFPHATEATQTLLKLLQMVSHETRQQQRRQQGTAGCGM